MTLYLVKFFKDILGENGRHSEVCQHYIEVEADDSGAACELAKQRFCESERLQDWSLHADRLHVAESELADAKPAEIDQPASAFRH